jgi:hypothetical protein
MELTHPEPAAHEPTPPRGVETLPNFSHLPPKSVKGRNRWPPSLEAQAFPATAPTPSLIDVLVWASPYLEQTVNSMLTCVATNYRFGPAFKALWFYRPWSEYGQDGR